MSDAAYFSPFSEPPELEWMLEAYVKGLRSIRGGKETRERT